MLKIYASRPVTSDGFQTAKRKAGDRVTSWMLLTFFFLLLSFNWIDFSFLYVKDTLVQIECEAVFRPIFFTW